MKLSVAVAAAGATSFLSQNNVSAFSTHGRAHLSWRRKPVSRHSPTAAFMGGGDGPSSFFDNIFAPLKEAKFGLVRSLAGDYDKDAVSLRLNGLIDGTSPECNGKKVIMLSFTT
mmetsp:Transcript_31007/g.61369  ORF Transcript_31007/g.61369 Transcript_31007/m.61369 type:complete len:114 (-) Transcript_31007:550-891(-)